MTITIIGINQSLNEFTHVEELKVNFNNGTRFTLRLNIAKKKKGRASVLIMTQDDKRRTVGLCARTHRKIHNTIVTHKDAGRLFALLKRFMS